MTERALLRARERNKEYIHVCEVKSQFVLCADLVQTTTSNQHPISSTQKPKQPCGLLGVGWEWFGYGFGMAFNQ